MNEPSSEFERGMEKMREVYAGDVVDLPEGSMPFFDVMQKTLFAQVWDRDVLPIRDRRLLIMAVLTARGATDAWKVQARASLRRAELTPEELRETLIMLAPYSGYAQLSDFVVPCEAVIGEFEAEQTSGDRSASSSMQDVVHRAGLDTPGDGA
jgi:4-carboxymuconolactone decarboxylase